MNITELALFLVHPRWRLLKISTDEGVSGLGETVVPGCAETVALGDGAPWNWNLVKEHFYESRQRVDW